jgi:peptidoglycan/LPS O-acetylase OafA/YrhL
MATFAWIALECLIPFSLGVVIAFAVPWRLRWVAVLGLALAGAFWFASVVSSTPEESYSDTPDSFWIFFSVLVTLVALALFCAGGWLGRTGRNAFLASRPR